MMTESRRNPRRTLRSFTMTIDAPPDEAFPYLCPQREHEYLADWKADIVFSESGYVEEGCIFRTRRPDDAAETVWVVTDHAPAKRRATFVMVTPGSRVGRLSVQCEAIDGEPARCAVTFTYEITALGPDGDRYLDAHFSAEAFEAQMRGYERAWNHYLATGALLGA